MRQETLEKLNKVKALIAQGYSRSKACATVGMADSTYNLHANTPAPKAKAPTRLVDLAATVDERVILLITTSSQVRTVLEQFR